MSIKIGNRKLSILTIAIVVIAITISAFLLPAFLAQPATASDPAVDNLGLLQMGTAAGGAHIQPCTGSSCGTGLAWAQIFNSTGGIVTLGANGVAATFIAENPNLPDNTVFTGKSNKNIYPISTTDPCFIASTCPTIPLSWATGNVPAKDVLTNVYEYAATNPANGHLIIYSGFERIAPNGDSHIDIEFYQNQVHLSVTPPCPTGSCAFVGQHTPGDVIVSMDFAVGGTLGNFSARTWTGSTYSLAASGPGEGCTSTGTVCAFNNGANIAGGSWPSYDSHGNVITTLPSNSFTNFGIDVTALLGNTPCFSTTIGKTRSSGSFTAELKDFAGPTAFGICSANIKIAPSAVNEVGVTHTFTVTFTQKIGGVSSAVPNGTKVTVTLTASNGAVISNKVDTCASTGTINGACTVSFTSFTGGTVTGTATGTVVIAGTPFTATTNGKTGNSGPAIKTFVDAFIAIAPNAVNQVNQFHTFTVTAKQNSGNGAGFVSAPNGTIVTVTLTPTLGASVSSVTNTCATTGTINGVCTVKFTSPTGGVVNGTATVSLTIMGITVTRTTNGQGLNSAPAIKKFVDAFITIVPSAVNQVNQFHTFTITVKEDAGNGLGFVFAPDGTKPTVTLTPANGATVTSLTDNCATTGTVSGVCTVTFTSPTGGTVTGSASVTLTIAGISVTRSTNGSGQNSGPVVKTFVDSYITIGPSAINSIFVTHTFTVTVKQDSGNGSGFVNAPDGTIVKVTLTPSNGANLMNVVDNCATKGTVGGTCTVSFTSSTAGTVTGSATVTLNIDGINVTRSTDGTAKNSGPATKQFVAGSLAWTKVDNVGNLLAGATFQVCRVANFITTSGTNGVLVPITPVCINVTDNQAPDQNPIGGQFLLTGLQLGNYTVQETVAPPGFTIDPRIATAVLTINTPSVTIIPAFGDQRPILKLSGFGYTNTPTSTASQCPTVCTINGTTIYSITIHNYGLSAGLLTGSLAVTATNTGSGSLTCSGGCTLPISGTVAAGADATFSLTIQYTNMPSGAVITANLTASYTTSPSNGLVRTVNGTPATISFTVQAN